jgi:hypothetical protein
MWLVFVSLRIPKNVHHFHRVKQNIRFGDGGSLARKTLAKNIVRCVLFLAGLGLGHINDNLPIIGKRIVGSPAPTRFDGLLLIG